MLILAMIEGIKKLNKPCNIKAYIHGPIGLLGYNNKRKGDNKDLKYELLNLLLEGNIKIK